jgi:plastocyanin
MQFITLLAALPAVALAQYNYGGSDSASTTLAQKAAATAAAATNGIHIVKVGQTGLTFEPNNMTVPVGDTVEFHFWPKAHSVAQSSFDNPCQPLNTTSFFSGPVAIASGMSPTVYSIKVTSAGPIWYYCATGTHCQSGMGGVINPPAANQTRTITNYLAGAAKAQANTAPSTVQGGTLGAAAAAASGTASPSATSTPGAASRGAVSWGLLGVAGLIGAAVI